MMPSENSLAPIILFTFNRLDHTQKTIEALKKNPLAQYSHLIVFNDAPKNQNQQDDVLSVRRYLKKVDGFKSIELKFKEKNMGLAQSIILGVTEIIELYGKVIVLEDDIVTSPSFLNYMNEALNFYEDKKSVWHISGWNYPINIDNLNSFFFTRIMNCWGWATWKDRWNYFEKNPQKVISNFTREDITRFDFEDSEAFWYQIKANIRGKINTWAIFWYATIFKNNGLCLNPTVRFIENIGLDGSGVHCNKEDNMAEQGPINTSTHFDFPEEIIESPLAYQRIKILLHQQKKSFLEKVIGKIKSLLRS